MQMPVDYPRINQFPEWFTVGKTNRLTVTRNGNREIHTGDELIKGLVVSLEAGETFRLSVAKAGKTQVDSQSP
jgi:hypothetical protein